MQSTTETNIVTKNKILVAYIDKQWISKYMIWYLNGITAMEAYVRAKSSNPDVYTEKDMRHFHFHEHALHFKSIKYNSPGWIEVILSASTITAIIALLKHYVPNAKQVKETKRIEAEIIRLEIENLKEMGFSKKEIKNLFAPKLKETLKKVERIEFLLKLGAIVKVEGKDLDNAD